MGPTTKAAVRAFQETNGIPVDGTITDALVEAMESRSAAATPQPVTDEPRVESPAVPCPTLDDEGLAEVAQWLDMGVSDDNIGSLFKITPACAKQWREAVER